MEKYRLINNIDGQIVYHLALDPELSSQEQETRMEKKKNQMVYEKNIPYEQMFWENYK